MRRESMPCSPACRVGRIAVALLLAACLGGCSTVRVQAPERPGVADRQTTAWSYAWGLIPAFPEVDCQGQALAEVTVESNLAYDLLSVITLGLVSPKTVEWKCAGATPSGGTITLPTPPPSEGGTR